MRQGNPHISRRKGGAKTTSRKYSFQSLHNFYNYNQTSNQQSSPVLHKSVQSNQPLTSYLSNSNHNVSKNIHNTDYNDQNLSKVHQMTILQSVPENTLPQIVFKDKISIKTTSHQENNMIIKNKPIQNSMDLDINNSSQISNTVMNHYTKLNQIVSTVCNAQVHHQIDKSEIKKLTEVSLRKEHITPSCQDVPISNIKASIFLSNNKMSINEKNLEIPINIPSTSSNLFKPMDNNKEPNNKKFNYSTFEHIYCQSKVKIECAQSSHILSKSFSYPNILHSQSYVNNIKSKNQMKFFSTFDKNRISLKKSVSYFHITSSSFFNENTNYNENSDIKINNRIILSEKDLASLQIFNKRDFYFVKKISTNTDKTEDNNYIDASMLAQIKLSIDLEENKSKKSNQIKPDKEFDVKDTIYSALLNYKEKQKNTELTSLHQLITKNSKDMNMIYKEDLDTTKTLSSITNDTIDNKKKQIFNKMEQEDLMLSKSQNSVSIEKTKELKAKKKRPKNRSNYPIINTKAKI